MDMMLTGRTYGAEEGQAMGLSHYLVEKGEGLAKGIELAERIADQCAADQFRHHAGAAAHRRERSGERLSHRVADGRDRAGAATRPRRG